MKQTIRSLKACADTATAMRGHKMNGWKRPLRGIYYNECLVCHKTVTVNGERLPSQFELTGDAMADNCTAFKLTGEPNG